MHRAFAKLAVCAGLFFVSSPVILHAQVAQAEKRTDQKEQNEFTLDLINTAIFAAILGYFVWKHAPAFFNARSADIQGAIREATGLKMDADLRYSEADRKLATLAEEIKRIRAEAGIEMEREHERIRVQTEAEKKRIQQQAAAEIESIRLDGLRRVRRRVSAAAIDLAERRLREKGAAQDENLVREFVQTVGAAK